MNRDTFLVNLQIMMTCFKKVSLGGVIAVE